MLTPNMTPNLQGGKKRRLIKATTKARGLSPKIAYILEELVESTLINKLKSMSFEEFSNINGSNEEEYEAKSSRSSQSSSSSQSSTSNLFSFNINYKPLILKNATIQDKAYVSIIRNNYDAMQENYKSMIDNMETSLFKSAFKSAFNSTKKASISMLKRVGRTFKRKSSVK